SSDRNHLLTTLRTLPPVPDSPLHAGYNGISPYKLGEHNIKIRVVPAPEKCPAYQVAKRNQEPPNFPCSITLIDL
ncbi:hypothetical protein ACLBQC_32455, partial [Klebsiella pneumoniae]|uniref:hypothetical protein n=1 Tax=Klebsiella pneumoniae TaxID=573 RepID=UPI0039699139